ncbi:MAG: polyphosphate:AMP phosphotransferase, partial [Myxococcales bacterium]|nr:polyphosphate:AMP phosphotransferase [Myxococcales bacterium]
LLDAQYALLQSKAFPMIILVNGVDGAGKGETVNLLTEWMDPRHIQSHAFGAKLPEEMGRPEMWRFWRALPPKGKIGVLFGNWYTSPIVDRVQGRTKDAALAADLVRVRRFEKLLTDDGAVLVKLWFHLSKSAQRKRLKELESSARTRWRVTPNDWKAFKSYSKYAKISERVLRETST